MRRSIRNLLGLAAATAATAVALSVPAAAANAATPEPAKKLASPSASYWGPYFAKNFKAKAHGSTQHYWNHKYDTNKVLVKGKLWDLDHRTYKQGGKCAYVEFRARKIGAPYWKWQDVGSYKWCGAGEYKSFAFWTKHTEVVQARVGQVGKWGQYPIKKSDWKDVFVLN